MSAKNSKPGEVWKFTVKPETDFAIEMPVGAQILTVQMNGSKPMFWALVKPSNLTEVRRFSCYGTGHAIERLDDLKYIGTFQMDITAMIMVFHLFERVG